MKKLFLFLGLILSVFVSKASGPDDILGTWTNGNGKAHIVIYKEGNKYFGKISWLAQPNNADGTPKTDKKNPDPTRHGKPLVGAVVLRNFVYKDGEWSDGRIYDPQNGKDYKSYMTMKDNGRTLNVRGYIGLSFIGRTEVWVRKGNT